MSLPRGVRLCNPGNIRLIPAVQWVGQVPGSDPDFVTFSDAKYGIRALAEILRAYWTRDGVNTIREAISRWAPSVENNTASYVDDVAQRCGVDPDVYVGLPEVLPKIVPAIIAHENANYAYPAEVVAEGLRLAA